MSSKSEYRPNPPPTWTAGRMTLAMIAVITIAAFSLWVFYFNPNQN